MGFLQHPGIAIGTILTMVVLAGLIIGIRTVRKKLLPDEVEKEKGLAQAELLLLQARLEEKMKQNHSRGE